MALVEGDIVMITMNGTLFGERCSNVWFYECTDNTGNANLLQVAQEFRALVWQAWIDLTSEDYKRVNVKIDNLTNGLDFADLPVAGDGLVLSPACSSAVAGGFTLSVSTRLTRPGSKRMAGIPEVTVADNLWTPEQADMNILTSAMLNELDLDNLNPAVACMMNPIVVGRFPITHEDAGKIDISRFQSITGIHVSATVTTQTSRRPGRGE